MRRTACIAKPATSRILPRISTGWRLKVLAARTTRTCNAQARYSGTFHAASDKKNPASVPGFLNAAGSWKPFLGVIVKVSGWSRRFIYSETTRAKLQERAIHQEKDFQLRALSSKLQARSSPALTASSRKTRYKHQNSRRVLGARPQRRCRCTPASPWQHSARQSGCVAQATLASPAGAHRSPGSHRR